MPKNYQFDKDRPMGEHEVVFIPIEMVKKQTEDEYLFRFKTSIHHDPGQFFQCSLFGIGESAISICSYGKDFFEMSIRAVGNVTNKLCALKKGEKIGLRGPYGHGYHMPPLHGKDILIFGGGSGVAPVRGIMQYIQQHREKFGSVDLFFGFRTEKDILFEKDFPMWEKSDMSVNIAFSQDADHSQHPKAIKGYVSAFIKNHPHTQDHKNKVVFVCGPPVMIHSTAKELIEEKGFSKDQIYFSAERHMKCAVGRCGHCMIYGKYCCTDGPVFRYDEWK
jgi:sulfite reductase subunit B